MSENEPTKLDLKSKFEASGLTYKQIGELAKVSRSTVHRIINNPNSTNYGKIETALDKFLSKQGAGVS